MLIVLLYVDKDDSLVSIVGVKLGDPGFDIIWETNCSKLVMVWV